MLNREKFSVIKFPPNETLETLRNRSLGILVNHHDRGIVRVTNVHRRSHRWNSMECLPRRIDDLSSWHLNGLFGRNDSFADPCFCEGRRELKIYYIFQRVFASPMFRNKATFSLAVDEDLNNRIYEFENNFRLNRKEWDIRRGNSEN